MLEKYRLTDEQIQTIKLSDYPVRDKHAEARAIADAQLEAVKPAIEEARKEERDRIKPKLNELTDVIVSCKNLDRIPNQRIIDIVEEIWQALKEGESPSGVEE